MIRKGFSLLQTLISQKNLIYNLARREISAQYQGSLLGFVWAIINPLVSVSLYWFVFSFGFRVQPVAPDVPFVVWLTAGLAIWMFFSEVVLGSSEMIIQNSQLIKKTLFKAQVLPIVKILSAAITHLIFVCILLLLMFFNNQRFSFYFFQAAYYFFSAAFLSLGMAWFFSSITVFVRDAAKFLNLLMQIVFWITPIFWDLSIMSDPRVATIMKYNPVFYLVEGYRDSFIKGIPFWDKPYETLIFWMVSSVIILCGASVFLKLKPHFPDVL